MPRLSNSAIERHYFSSFLRDFQLPTGEVIYGDKPDVTIRGERTIGIEIANLYLLPGGDTSSEQVQRARRNKAIERAQQMYLNSGGKKYEWTFSFDPRHPIVDLNATADRLLSTAQLSDSRSTGELPRHIRVAAPELSFAYLYAEERSDARWRLAQQLFVPVLDAERVRQLVASKDVLLPGYQPCDAYWLLLVVDLMDSAQDQEIDWPNDQPPIPSKYERVVIYKPQFGRWTEAPVARVG